MISLAAYTQIKKSIAYSSLLKPSAIVDSSEQLPVLPACFQEVDITR